MKRKKVSEEYFGFNRKSRLAIFVLLIILVLTTFLPRFFALTTNKITATVDTAWIAAVRKLEVRDANLNSDSIEQDDPFTYQFDRPENPYTNTPITRMFYFDPNNTSAEEWKKLGIKERTITTIQNYLAKGGRFKIPEDLKKIYGLHEDEYKRLFPLIRIKEEVNGVETSAYKDPAGYKSKANYTIIDINTADTTAFISLPGIGSKLAARIIAFREKLGGFYSIDQIKETYGLPDSTFQKIKPYLKASITTIKKININTATADELKAHPYIKYNIANPLIAYRKQHGPFEKIEDIKKVMVVTDEVYEKINAYLAIQ